MNLQRLCGPLRADRKAAGICSLLASLLSCGHHLRSLQMCVPASSVALLSSVMMNFMFDLDFSPYTADVR